MKAEFEEILISVVVGKGRVLVRLKPSNSREFAAHPVHSDMVFGKAREPFLTIPLQSSDILAANDELREILGKRGSVQPSCFYYIPPGSRDLNWGIMIEDCDPGSHLDICVDGITPFRKDDRKAAKLFEALAKSPYCEPASLCWRERPSNPELQAIRLRLKQGYARSSARLKTYQALAELF